ncbi:MAG: hypothetical protein IKB49_01400 [Alphaproteobacteria bacterium]|nr:hypothetical protein [Alphaproteobacteria bacterium]
MRKLATCFFALAICAPAVSAASAASRVIPSTNTKTTAGTSATVATERVAPSSAKQSRTAISRNVTTAVTPTTSQSGTAARSTVSRSVVAGGANMTLSDVVSTVGRNARVSSASINNNPTIRRAGLSLRPSTAEVGGRATIAGSGLQTGSNIDESLRSVQSRAASKEVTRESIAEAKERLEQLSELNNTCQQQYNDCMDQFCNVVDTNQGRCSCSGNLSKYTKVEEAVKEANSELNDVAQRIRYVGLSADEIRAILTATEAEEALSGQVDTTETRNMLAQIEDLIKDPTSATTYSADSFTGLDMDLDFTADSADLFSLDFLNTGTSGSFAKLRGTDLYNAAKKRCSTILSQCKEAGATSQQVTGNYELAIDKDCIAYEKGLTKMNDTLKNNVRSAERMLQKARLAVLQNKNQYDAKGCISALETCMKDDMVCGDNYYKCVDPTKRYIDENGKVVLGQDITKITQFMEDYNNASIDSGFLQKSIGNTVSMTPAACGTHQAIAASTDPSNDLGDGACVVKYLMSKIGTGQKVTDNGLCRAVLDKCQRYTYSDTDTYNATNDVVVNYIQRAMVNVRAAQKRIISEYSSNCMIDVATCYNQQVTQINTWSSSASINSIYNVMRGACRNVALTCGFAIFAGPPEIDNPESDVTVSGCKYAEGVDYGSSVYNDGIINCVSEMFYESLLCPDNSQYTSTEGTIGTADGDYVNARCKCLPGYQPYGTLCVAVCGKNAERNSYGTCVCKTGYTGQTCDACASGYDPDPDNDGVCIPKTGNTPSPAPSPAAQLPTDPTECEAVEYASWTDGKCTCDAGYKENNGTCVEDTSGA